jgi:serine/threonine-protein kinase ULK/ATG1
LTGKAPFTADSPQALKLFYEKHVNLVPEYVYKISNQTNKKLLKKLNHLQSKKKSIPNSTSPNLKDLLIKMLKRNPSDRINFEDFSTHKFLQDTKSEGSNALIELANADAGLRDLKSSMSDGESSSPRETAHHRQNKNDDLIGKSLD